MGFPHPYPLGLPKGTVRATITIITSIDFMILVFKDSLLANNLSIAVAVVLSFYFGGRMRATSVTAVIATDASQRAWGLPAGSIRSVLIVFFSSSIYYLYYTKGIIPETVIEVVNIIGGYIIGQIFTSIRNIIFGVPKNDAGVSIIDHIKAFVIIVCVIFTTYVSLISIRSYTTNWLLVYNIVIGFYFGERTK